MHLLWMLLFLLPGTTAPALHKCVGADGVASYQSLPCAAGQRTAWTRRPEPMAAAPPPPPPPPPRLAATSTVPRAAAAVRASTVRKPADPSATRCATARRAADLTRDRLWNRLTFRQRSDLDAKVAQACAKR